MRHWAWPLGLVLVGIGSLFWLPALMETDQAAAAAWGFTTPMLGEPLLLALMILLAGSLGENARWDTRPRSDTARTQRRTSLGSAAPATSPRPTGLSWGVISCRVVMHNGAQPSLHSRSSVW